MVEFLRKNELLRRSVQHSVNTSLNHKEDNTTIFTKNPFWII
ncbi:hypothetical protein DEU42_10585 [Flavobacterium sp. AG291]|nr:hypothetical protein DEU42_10585 [Flavobacterium sp. AG291]